MNIEEVTERLTNIFKEVFNNNALVLTNSLTANDVENWNSLTHMLLISEIEEAFSVKFKLKELNKMRNVGDMVEIIISKLSSQS